MALIDDMAQALRYWLPDEEPLTDIHDAVSEDHRAKWREADNVLERYRLQTELQAMVEQLYNAMQL